MGNNDEVVMIDENGNAETKESLDEAVAEAEARGDTRVEGDVEAEDEGDVSEEGQVEEIARKKSDVAKRLEQLARKATEEPLFASDRDTPQEHFPGSEESWFVPRPLPADEALRYRELMSGTPDVFTSDSDDRKISHIRTSTRQVEPFEFLCCKGIEEVHLVRGNGQVVKLQRDSKRDEVKFKNEIAHGLSPAHAAWLETFLIIYNGLDEAQEEAEDLA